MALLDAVAWRTLLIPDTPLLEIIARGTLVYLGTFLILRLVLKRESSGFSTTDLIVIVFIADAAQNAMADDYRSVPDGLILIATLVFWAWFLDFLAFRVPALERLLKPPPLPLIKEGNFVWPNMRREFITKEELIAHLREQGVEQVSDVRLAYMESDGHVSVLPYDEDAQVPPGPAVPTA